jgi:hypothetical protein
MGAACSGLGNLEYGTVDHADRAEGASAQQDAHRRRSGWCWGRMHRWLVRTLKRVRAGTAGTTEGPGHFAMVPRQIYRPPSCGLSQGFLCGTVQTAYSAA